LTARSLTVIGLYLGLAVVSAMEIFEVICLLVYVALKHIRGLNIQHEKTLDFKFSKKNGRKKSLREIVEEMEEKHQAEIAQLRKDVDELIQNSHLQESFVGY
jgi:hypothetical protein